MSMITDDLAAISGDIATTVAVSFGLQTCRGRLRWTQNPVTDHAGGLVLQDQMVLTIPGDVLTALAEDSTLVVDGTSYRVRQMQRTGPLGHMLHVVLVGGPP